SAACGLWLEVPPEDLLGRRAIAGVPASSDRLDRVAASLAAPPGLPQRGVASHPVRPPVDADGAAPPSAAGVPRSVLFIALDDASVLALADHALPAAPPADLEVALRIRQRLTAWRLRQPKLASLAVAQG